MLPNLLSTKDHGRRNPWQSKVDVAIVEVADCEREERAAIDELFLARAAYKELVKLPLTQVGDGLTGCRADGTVVTRWEIQKALQRNEEADASYVRASEKAAAARGKLGTLQAALQTWVRRGEYDADQARQRAAETPAEKAARDTREMEQQIRAVPR